MAEQNDGAEKTEEPTQRKLEQARAKGDVPKTPDFPQFMSFFAVAAVLAVAGGWMCRNLALELLPFISDPDGIDLSGQAGVGVARRAALAAAPLIVAVMAAAALAGAAGNLAQTGLMLTPDKLKPEWSKLSPIQGLKRLFGLDALMQFFKGLVKIVIVGALVWWILKPHLGAMTKLATMEPVMILPLTVDILKRLIFSVCGLLLVVSGADWFWQKRRFMTRMRMTKEELKEDFKQSEGDPHVKARQKQIRHTRARQRMMQAVPNATVVVMNPTHYAVALKYEQGEDQAPDVRRQGPRHPGAEDPRARRGIRRAGDRGPAAGARPLRRGGGRGR
ncbi:EscU/YscU/HrcU family type III secretion system export apparatus switch protein [Phenylobacterium sp. J367]|uniref:EscU/YscU/HrcU family type III secretion system export apparatus switch protein n=1 Tax=Phenylobacterium sp. J367 TaxID=2898435 RepID=UPI0027E2BF84|nr:EscU/YscU/HrcU family type III secretion system export apparatus switch protein [Phenylobacterium sp. J367]